MYFMGCPHRKNGTYFYEEEWGAVYIPDLKAQEIASVASHLIFLY